MKSSSGAVAARICSRAFKSLIALGLVASLSGMAVPTAYAYGEKTVPEPGTKKTPPPVQTTPPARPDLGTRNTPQAACEHVWAVSFENNPVLATVVTGTTVLNPSKTAGYLDGGLSAALAVNRQEPEAVYYTKYKQGTLVRADLTTGQETEVAKGAAWETNRLAFDDKGNLWSIAFDGRLYVRSADGKTSQAKTVKSDINNFDFARQSDGTGLTSGDIAFDDAGNMWILASWGRENEVDRETYLLSISRAELQKSHVTMHVVGKMETPKAGYYNGVAFGVDGTLYASTSGDQLYKVNPNNGQTEFLRDNLFAEGTVGDLASCVILHPELKATKAVSATENVHVGDVVTYTITVENVGNLGAVDAKLQDTLPTGVEYIPGSAKVNGERVPDNGEFPFAGGHAVKGTTSKNWGYVEAGDVSLVTFEARITAERDGQVCNTAKVFNGSETWNSNQVCSQVDATKFNAAKTVQTAGVSDVAGEYWTQYQIKVTNIGQKPGRYAPVWDELNVDPAFEVTGIFYTDKECLDCTDLKVAKDSKFALSQDYRLLQPGESHIYTVVVWFKVREGAKPQVCDGTAGHGLFNQVNLPGDADLSDNWACGNVPTVPSGETPLHTPPTTPDDPVPPADQPEVPDAGQDCTDEFCDPNGSGGEDPDQPEVTDAKLAQTGADIPLGLLVLAIGMGAGGLVVLRRR